MKRLREQQHRSNKKRYDTNPEKRVIEQMRYRAEQKGIPFSLTAADIPTPEYCPVLGIKLKRNGKPFADDSPSVDRIIPELGYVPGNVRVISMRANAIKKDATIQELRGIHRYILEHEKRVARVEPPSEIAA